MTRDPELLAHQEWLGYLQPVGLVVSPLALIAAGAVIDRNIGPTHRRFIDSLDEIRPAPDDDPVPAITDFPGFVRDILGWDPTFLLGGPGAGPLPDILEVFLENYAETLRPTYAVRELEPVANELNPWLMLIQVLPPGTDLDAPFARESHNWEASPHARFERLLRTQQVPIGLLSNGTHLRLVYAPRGENSGHVTFPVVAMAEVAGRPIFAALHLLLSQERLFSLPTRQRLPYLLAESRRYQNLVSTKLAQQMLAALYELLRGFQAADEQRRRELLREVLADHPDRVYEGLLTVLLRLIFVLYAEERGLLPGEDVYVQHYAVGGLFERLRDEAGRFPDTMDHRYGAWAQLLALFRLIHDGASHGTLRVPARHGHLFDPARFPFLEGRKTPPPPEGESTHSTPSPLAGEGRPVLSVVEGVRGPDPVPLLSDGVIHRVLSNLLVLDGERLSYRTLDVEQIGSVYEKMMGFSLMVTTGRSIALKPVKVHGAPAVINLDELLQVPARDRVKWVRERTDQDVTGESLETLKAARTPEQAEAALGRKVAREATPQIVPPGTMLLQPSAQRRRTGSHYTPRFFTEPIVREALRPVLVRLGPKPTPAQILDLNVCDIAMGSGAFLVETDRQLAEALVAAWHNHNAVPADIPPDEDELLHARRLIAQRCLYGVDKNPMAVDLAKLSLWLATLARDHAFTFLDHNLRCGDSLVGLTREQIASFHWEAAKSGQQAETLRPLIEKRLKEVTVLRAQIEEAADGTPEGELRALNGEATAALAQVCLAGDLVIGAFFAEEKPKKREEARKRAMDEFLRWFQGGGPDKNTPFLPLWQRGKEGDLPAPSPFHWEIEFPDVFGRENPGFDAVVGNPPFAGKNTITAANGPFYLDWLKTLHAQSHGNADLVAHFFRRAFTLIRRDGTFGLIATNTIAQGDTRESGLRWIRGQGGTIYRARRRIKWPGEAAVVVSIVHVSKKGPCVASGVLSLRTPVGAREALRAAGGPPLRATPSALDEDCPDKIELACDLDGRPVPFITAFLFDKGGDESPERLRANAGKSFQGSIVLGMGFTFDDTNPDATPIAEMERLIAKNPKNKERVFPYIGGEEVNSSPIHAHNRYVINFAEMTEAEARQGWPELMRIVEEKVKPDRMLLGDNPDAVRRKRNWWQWGRYTPALFMAIRGLERVQVISQTSRTVAFAMIPTDMVYSHKLVVFPFCTFPAFGLLQSLLHDLWARFLGSTMKDDAVYTPSDCFETFPFPPCLLQSDAHTESTVVAKGWRGGEVSVARSEVSTTEVRSDRTPQPAREQLFAPAGTRPAAADVAVPKDCFAPLAMTERLEHAGREYYEFRAALMVKNDEGLTKTYNRFHDPEDHDPEILRLRELHAAMDRAVLDAYGWTDIQPTCEFLLDYEDEDDEDDAGSPLTPTLSREGRGRKGRKKPWRYRWPDEIRDEVLARLLDLNRQRAEEERRPIYEADLAADNVAPEYKPKKPRGRTRKGPDDDGQGGLF